MLFFKKRFAIIILFAAVMIWSGIYITDRNMKSITFLSGEKPVEFQFEKNIIDVRFLGAKARIYTDSFKPQAVLEKISYMFSRMLSLVEIK